MLEEEMLQTNVETKNNIKKKINLTFRSVTFS
jgi:hypothetical protein